MKKSAALLLCLTVLLLCALPAQAVAVPDPDRIGSITFQMDWEGKPLDSGKLTMHRVGEIVQENGDYSFALVPALRDSGLSLDSLNDTRLPQQLADLVQEKGISGVTAPIADGQAVFSDLLPGVYVVTQTEADACDGFASIQPFLISLPRMEGDVYVYDLVAQPKVSLETEPTEPPTTTPPPSDPSLPQTGQLNWPVPVMVAAGLAFLTVGWFLCFGKKETHEE